jgi:hypothetical protein
MTIALKQTRNSNCGQTCIAIITGKTVAEAEKAVGHGHATYGKDLIAGVEKLGCVAGPMISHKTIGFKIPHTGFLLIGYQKKSGGRISSKLKKVGHWVVVVDGVVYNPNGTTYPFTIAPGTIVNFAIEVLVP